MKDQIFSRVYTLVILVSFIACDDFSSTLTDQPIVTIGNTSVPADGSSIVEILIESSSSGQPLSAGGELTISVTDGLLFASPVTDFSAEGSRQITQLVDRSTFTAYLKSGVVPTNRVFLTVDIGAHQVKRELSFVNNPVTIIILAFPKDSLKLGSSDFIDFQVIFRSDVGLPSLEQRMNTSISFEPIHMLYQKDSVGRAPDGGDSTFVYTIDTTMHVENLIYYDPVRFILNDTISYRISPRSFQFPDRQIREASATIEFSIGDVSRSESIRIVK